MWLTRFALRRPVTITMIFASFVVLGLAGSRLLKLEYFPEVQFPGVFVQANYPGSTPAEIEAKVTKPMEEALATMSGVKRMQSTTNGNQSSIFLLFDWSANAKLKGVEAREKIDAIRDQLPADLERIFVFTGSTNNQPIVEARLSSSTDLSDRWEILNRQLKQRLERIPGVSKVNIHGVAAKSYQILLSPEKLVAYHIDVSDLLRRLRSANALVSAGEIKGITSTIRITLNSQYKRVQDIKNLVVNRRGLKLSDIAKIKFAKSEISVGRHLNRKYAVGISVTREAGANLVRTGNAVVKRMKEIQNLADFKGIELFVMENQADGVVDSLKDIAFSGLVGLALSTLVLYGFLRDVRLTLVVSLAVPFSILITLALMYLTNMSLNVLSMMGLMLAIGMLVDNAVVVSESIFTQRSHHPKNPRDAALAGVKAVALPVVAGTATTAIVFLPNIIGEKINITIFLSHVAITIVISLIASLFIAATIIPLFLSRQKIAVDEEETKSSAKAHGMYTRLLAWLIEHKIVGASLALFLALSMILPAMIVKTDMFPQEEQQRLYITYHVQGTYNLARVEKAVDRMENFLYAHKRELDLENVYSYYTETEAGSTLLLVDKKQRRHTLVEMRKYIQQHMPKFAIARPSFDRKRLGGSEALSMLLQGEDTGTLQRLANDVTTRLNRLSSIQDARLADPDTSREVRVTLNRARLEQRHLSPQQVAQNIAVGLRKTKLKTFRGRNGEVDVTVSFQDKSRASLDDLLGLPIELSNGKQVRLDNLAKIEVVQAVPQIRRVNRRTGMRITLEYGDVPAAQVRKQVRAAMGQLQLPKGYSWTFGQASARENKAQQIMLQNMLLAVMMIFIVMAALFESLLFPLAVISSIVYAIAGVFWYFLFTGTTLSLMGMIGILVLMGVVVNNGIVLVDRINFYREAGQEKRTAVLNAANDRLRPILMTVLTTVLGLLPLSLGNAQIGGNGPAYYPMARAIIGGLTYSTFATLLCLPLIYLFLDHVRDFYARLWHATKSRLWGARVQQLHLEWKPAQVPARNDDSQPNQRG